MLNLISASIFINFFTCFLLTILMVTFGRKYKYFALFNINVCFWSLFYGLSINAPNQDLALQYTKLTLFFIIFIPYLGLRVANEVTGNQLNKFTELSIGLATIIISGVTLFSSLVVIGTKEFMSFKYVPILTPIYYITPLYFIAVLTLAHIIVIKSIRKNYKHKFILAGFVIGFLGGGTNFFVYLNLPIYPYGNFLIPFYSIITAYAVLQHRIYDLSSTVSKLIIKVCIVSFFIFSYSLLLKVYELVVSEPNSILIMALFNVVFFVSTLEFYRFFNKKLEKIRQSLVREKTYNKQEVIEEINRTILDVVDLDVLTTNLEKIVKHKLKIKIKSFYISNQIDPTNEDGERGFIKFLGEQIDSKDEKNLTNLILKNKKLKLSIKFDELDHDLKSLMEKIDCKGFIPFVFQDKVVGFMIIHPRPNKKDFFFYEDMEVFDDLVLKVGIALERVRLHLKFVQEREKALKSLAGSIAHELRNPLSSIRMSAASVDVNKDYLDRDKLKHLTKEQLEEIVFNETTEVSIHKGHLDKSVNLANSVIDMTLADLSGKKPDKDSYKYINIYKATKDAIDVFAFKDQEERERVIINLGKELSKESDNFIFKGEETAYYYILFNLIKNALYYVKDKPDLNITLSKSIASYKNHSRLDPNLSLDKSKTYNVLTIKDTGPGIPPDILAKLFGSFVTSGKKEGTGLGLAFCKRTMIDFGGDINCESEVGKYTKFSLYFPALDEEELKIAKDTLNNVKSEESAMASQDKKTLAIPKKILLVDDEVINIKISQRFISNHISNVVIDTASDGKEALKLFKQNNKTKESLKPQDFKNITDPSKLSTKLKDYKYDLIITDIQMPEMDGFALAKEIRKLDSEVPITVYTSRTSYKVKQKAIDLHINDYVLKPIPNNQFTKIIHKWIINDRKHNYNLEQVKTSLKGLKIFIADDEKINHMTLGRVLKKYDISVETADGGEELLEKYKNQFPKTDLKEFKATENDYYQDPRFINQYDIIIVDINMPDLPGMQATKQIRDFELIYNVRNKATIIAYSGDEDPKLIKQFLQSGMDDYFTKGGNHEDLLQIIYYWQNYNKTTNEPKFLNSNKKTHKEISKDNNSTILNPRLNNEELLEIREAFIKSSIRLVNSIKQDKKTKNLESLAFNSHALKGISGNIGAEKLFLHISTINNHAKNNKWPKNKKWFEDLEDIVRETENQLLKIK